MITARHFALPSLLAVLFVVPGFAQSEYPRPEDVVSPEAIVEAAYGAIQRAPGENFVWDRFRSLMLPNATLIPNTEQVGGQFTVLSPDGFVEWVEKNSDIGGPNDRGLSETSINNVVHRYGDIATIFSTYQKRFWDDPQVLGRGINAFQVVQNGGRWWIVSIIWDEENGAGPIPASYAPSAGH